MRLVPKAVICQCRDCVADDGTQTLRLLFAQLHQKKLPGERVHLDLAVSLLGKKTATESHGDRSVCLVTP